MLSKFFPLNVGPVDRAIRVVLALVLIPVGLWVLNGVDASVIGIVVATVGLIPLVTGATGRCPSYVLFRFTTVGGPHRLPATTGAERPTAKKVFVSAASTRGGDQR